MEGEAGQPPVLQQGRHHPGQGAGRHVVDGGARGEGTPSFCPHLFALSSFCLSFHFPSLASFFTFIHLSFFLFLLSFLLFPSFFLPPSFFLFFCLSLLSFLVYFLSCSLCFLVFCITGGRGLQNCREGSNLDLLHATWHSQSKVARQQFSFTSLPLMRLITC